MRFLADRFGPRRPVDRHQRLRRPATWPARWRERGETGSIVTLLCDRADRYRDTFCDDAWLRAQGIDTTRYDDAVASAWVALGA